MRLVIKNGLDVFDAISERRSVRKFKDEPVPYDSLLKILEAARLAPSAGNRQPWMFIVIKDREKKKELARASNNQLFMEDAGIIITVLSDPDKSPKWYLQDPMIAVEHMCLEAVELGLGTRCIGAFDESSVKHILGIPDKIRVICLLTIGTPAEKPSRISRKGLSDIVFEEIYDNPIRFQQ
ncbi:MAG: nitroreductase family protein [Candidatus Methylarchaceae archaeon HK01B]|nr:nitroreductase family protein [Candidatus Methylarchaceae archaeon HK01B]